MHVMTAEGGNLRIRGDIYSMHSPNRVDVLVNGERVATWEISWDLFRAVEPVTLHLEIGQNRSEFERDRFELSQATRLNRGMGLYFGWRP